MLINSCLKPYLNYVALICKEFEEMRVQGLNEWLIDRTEEARGLIKVILSKCKLPDMIEIDRLVLNFNSSMKR